MTKLPIGIQHFTVLREDGYVYVDKTEQIYHLMSAGRFLFFARPRRFGKSLLVTTLAEIYRGNRALFQGLWIEDKIDWQPYPVILLNFNDLDYQEQTLADSLARQLDRIAAQHQLVLPSVHYKDKFYDLITTLGREQKIVLLVDEYDKPITDLLENEQKVAEHIVALKNFYSVIKSTSSEYIHFAFFTGVSKYGKISLFSDLNNLLDITLDRRFATLVGYTQAELEHYFGEYIDRLAEFYELPRPDMLRWIQYWYNGYSWDGVQRLYVPFSTLVFLEQQTFANHWFATATPSFLLKLLRKYQIPAYALEKLTADNILLDNADVNNINVFSLLFQTGYLTVKRSRPTLQGQRYDLGYPNHEVAQAFQQYLLADYLKTEVSQLRTQLVDLLEELLKTRQLQRFMDVLNTVFASIPHTLFLAEEAYYHSLFYLLLKLLGFDIRVEPLSSQGRTDAVLELSDVIYIVEFKMSTAQVALDQIKARGYDQPYRASGKAIVLLGIAFDKAARKVGDWQSEAY